jgi:hypothetical protein
LFKLGEFFFQNKMVKIALQLKALLENVTGIEAEGEDFRWAYPAQTTYHPLNF